MNTDILVSVFAGAAATQGTTTTLRVIYDRIRGDELKEAIKAIRGAGDKTVANNLKKALPAFTPSGVFSQRNKNGLISHSGFVCLDIDGMDAHEADTLRDQLKSDCHVKKTFVSPGGKGVKAFFRCDPNRPHLESWNACNAYLKTIYSREADPATKDVCRLCYLSHDPHAYLADGEVEMTPYPHFALSEPAETTSSSQIAIVPVAEAPCSADDVIELLRYVPPEPPYDKWIKIIAAVASVLSEAEGIAVLMKWSPEKTPGEYAEKWTNHLDKVSIGTLIYFAREGGWKPSAAFKSKLPLQTVTAAETTELLARISACEFGVGPEPVQPVPRLLINGVPVSTPGNLLSVQAQAKSGKSAYIGAMLAAILVGEKNSIGPNFPDCLGLEAANCGGKAVLHLDSEQCRWDHYRGVRRSLNRAQVPDRPPWLRSFGLAGFSYSELIKSLRLLCAEEAAKNGVFAIVIDGIADLVSDVNETKECNALVAELQDLAIRHDCSIIVVVHENPAQKTGKARGHLGSQLERKAETTLRLQNKGEVISVSAIKTRGAPISEKFGPRFKWSEELSMHVSVGSGSQAQEDEEGWALRELAEEVLTNGPLQYVPLRDGIVAARGVGSKTAEKRIRAMTKAGIIHRDTGSKFYILTQQ